MLTQGIQKALYERSYPTGWLHSGVPPAAAIQAPLFNALFVSPEGTRFAGKIYAFLGWFLPTSGGAAPQIPPFGNALIVGRAETQPSFQRNPLSWLTPPQVFTLSVSGAVSPNGVLLKQAQKILTGVMAPTGALIKQVGKIFAGAISPSGALANALAQIPPLFSRLIVARQEVFPYFYRNPLSWLVPSGATTFQISLSGAVSPTGNLIKQARKILAGAISPAGSLIKQIAKLFSGTLSPSGMLSNVRTKLLSLAGAISPSGALKRQVGKALAGAISPSGSIIKFVARSLSGAISPSGLLFKSVLKLFSGAISPIGALINQIFSGLFQKKIEADLLLVMQLRGDVEIVQQVRGDVVI